MKASVRAYSALRDDIISNAIEPGTVLTEVDLAERLGVSRTPVREAFSRLIADGLLAPHGRSAIVTEIQPEGITHLFDVRIALEVRQAQLAAASGSRREEFAALADAFEAEALLLPERIDAVPQHFDIISRLDRALDEACENQYLVDMLAQLRTHLARIRHRAGRNILRLVQAAHEHANISRAIAQGNAELAGHATHVHLANSLANILRASEFASTSTEPGRDS